MTQCSIQPQTRQTMFPDMPMVLLNALPPAVSTFVLVPVVITVLSGAGSGFA